MKINFIKYTLSLISFMSFVGLAHAADVNTVIPLLQKTVDKLNVNVDAIPGTLTQIKFKSFDVEDSLQIIYITGLKKCSLSADRLTSVASTNATWSYCNDISADEVDSRRVLTSNDVKRATYNLAQILKNEMFSRYIAHNMADPILKEQGGRASSSVLLLDKASAADGSSDWIFSSTDGHAEMQNRSTIGFFTTYKKDANNRFIGNVLATGYAWGKGFFLKQQVGAQ